MSFTGKLYRDRDQLRQSYNPKELKVMFVEQFSFSSYPNNEIFNLFDLFAETGVNGFRCFGFWPYGMSHEQEPYIRTGSTYRLDKFNPAFFDYLDEWMRYALKKAIVVKYELFDRCGLTTRPVVSDHHPFHQLVGRDEYKFSDLKNRDLVTLQKRYLDKIVPLLAQYPNVIFGIMNEFTAHADWHVEMSKHVHALAPDHLISGTCHGNPAIKPDKEVDMWWVHTGTYEFDTGQSHVADDIKGLRQKTGNHKILGYSTDGFGSRGRHRENPQDMTRLAQDAKGSGIQMLSFLDHQAERPTPDGHSEGLAERANTATYLALTETFRPTPLGEVEPNIPLPAGVLQSTPARKAFYTHPQAFMSQHGRSVYANRIMGFLFFGNYKKDYPTQRLMTVFTVFIDNNTYDDAYIAIIDVVKNRQHVVVSRLLRRSEFPKAGEHCRLTLDFHCDDTKAEYESRVLYLGHTYLAVEGGYIIDPAILSPDDIPLHVY